MKTRAEYHRSVETQLRDWEARISILRVEVDRQQEKNRSKYLEQIEGLRKEKAEIQEDLDRLQKASGKSWVDIMRGIERALGEFKSSFHSTALRVI